MYVPRPSDCRTRRVPSTFESASRLSPVRAKKTEIIKSTNSLFHTQCVRAASFVGSSRGACHSCNALNWQNFSRKRGCAQVLSVPCRLEECEEPGCIKASARPDAAANVKAERADPVDRIPDVSSMQTPGKEYRDLHLLPDSPADFPVVTPAGPSEFLHGHVRST